MYGDSIGSFIGNPTLLFDSVKDMHSSVFSNCAATAATIVSGAIAERTKFLPTLSFL
jgi:Amt family ammonium transporter